MILIVLKIVLFVVEKKNKMGLTVLIFLERDNKIEENERNDGKGDSPSLTTTLLPILNNTIITLQKLITANNKITREINLLLLFLL